MGEMLLMRQARRNAFAPSRSQIEIALRLQFRDPDHALDAGLEKLSYAPGDTGLADVA